MSFLPKWFLPVVVAVLVLLGVGAVTVAFAFGITRHQWDGPATRRFASVTGFPAARLASTKIPYTDYLQLMDAQKILLATEAAKQQGLNAVPEIDRRKGAVETLLKNQAVEVIAEQEKIVITPLDIDRFFDQLTGLASTSTTTTVQSVDEYLRDNFGWTQTEYKKYVVRPGMLREIIEQKRTQNGNTKAMDAEINERVQQSDVKRYLQL